MEIDVQIDFSDRRAEALERLSEFAARSGHPAPESAFEGQGADLTFSGDLLAYADATGLSLDWMWRGTTCSRDELQ